MQRRQKVGRVTLNYIKTTDSNSKNGRKKPTVKTH